MLLLAENKPLQPYGLARKLDLARHVGLGHKLKPILHRAKLNIAGRKEANEQITDEEIRLEALEIVKKYIVFSSLSVDEHRQWDAAERLVAAMQAKCDREMEKLDAFIKSRTKSPT
jgi:hypothetical protein